MPVTVGVVAVGALAAAAAMVWTRFSPDPGSPERTEQAIVDAAERRPSLVRVIRSLPSRAAGSTFIAGSLVAVLALAAIAGSMLDMINRGGGLAQWDEAVAEWGAANATAWSTRALAIVTQLGSSAVAIIASAVVGYVEWRRRGNHDVPLFLAVTYLGHALISNGLKWMIDRERPLVEHLVGTASSSFPSTHSGTAAAVWAAIALVVGAGRSAQTRVVLAGGAALITGLVASSRALLGVHWLTDVVAGVTIGLSWFLLVAVAFGGRLMRLGEPADRVKAETSAT